MSEALRAALAHLDRGEPAVLVSVAETRGSTPRETGAVMLVAERAVAGTIGGGQLEWRAIEAAREMLAGGEAVAELNLPLGPLLAQCCGGQVVLRLARLAVTQRGGIEQALEQAAERLPLVALFGAGHVGRAVASALAPLPCRIVWIDSRKNEFPARLPANATPRLADEPAALAASLPAGAFWLVMTHSHPLDLDIVEAALRRDDVAWLGLIGSDTKRARFTSQLKARGVSAERIGRLVCPIGLAGIAGKEPAVIAASVAAQLLIAFEAVARRRSLAGATA
ncbi:xanthine dehydrogenase accessory protein XdhC [Geminicoccaceae bacterium 1502E]|nr:xanthine dehydrogenase accessory protein XdhC [Geminicoccaceae bacterium 1502E]